MRFCGGLKFGGTFGSRTSSALQYLSLSSQLSPLQHHLPLFGLNKSYSSLPRNVQHDASSSSSSPAAEASITNSSSSNGRERSKVSILDLQRMFRKKEPITMLTAHDYPSASLAQRGGVEIVLVGDSLAMVALGHPSTVNVTMDEMLHHCRAVARGATLPFLVGDMPFGSYQSSIKVAIENATRFLKEGNMEAVKIEGGAEMHDTIKAIVRAGIPVMGHIGLTPQKQSMLGGYRVQGKTAEKAVQLLEDAKSLQDAGCFSIVIEAIPGPVARHIAEKLSVPTIGIGAGSGTGGQVLVQQDMLGMFGAFVPRFCKQYVSLDAQIVQAIANYASEVKARQFPALEHCYPMKPEELRKWEAIVSSQK